MNYWRFRAIISTLKLINKKQSGQPIVHQGISRSSKDMIAKRKAQR